MGAEVVAEGAAESPAAGDDRLGEAGPGDLFFGLRGEKRDGGDFAARGDRGRRLGRGRLAPVALVLANAIASPKDERRAWVFVVEDPLAAMHSLAQEYRRALGARVVGVTGSVGKTSVKDIARALLPGRVHANRENLNTEIGLPLTILEAPDDTETSSCWRWRCAARARSPNWRRSPSPRSAVITNVGPVHVELLGSVEAIAAAKAEILDDLPPGGTAVAPVEAGVLEPHLEPIAEQLRFGPGGDVEATRGGGRRGRHRSAGPHPARQPALPLPLRRGPQPHQRAGRDRRRRRPRRRPRRDGRPRCGHRILPLPRRATGATRRNRPRERLLQRQPGVDARGARPSRHPRRRALGRGPGRDGRARAGLGRATTARSASTPAPPGSTS